MSPVCWGRGGDPPMGIRARCRGYRPLFGAGTKRLVTSPSRHNSPPGRVRPIAPAAVGEGARGSAVPLRTPGDPHCLYNATQGGAGSDRTCGPRRPCRRGVRGGVPGGRAVGWRAACTQTALLQALPPSWSAEERKGFWGPRPGSLALHTGSWGFPPGGRWPPPFMSCARGKRTGCGQGRGVA